MTERQSQLAASVREIQTALDLLSRHYPALPTLIPDGRYGASTAEAVRIFQTAVGLPPTGEVDLATWNALSAEYRRAVQTNAPPNPIGPFPDMEGVQPDSKAEVLYILQVMLRALALQYALPVASLSGQLDNTTADALRAFQIAQGLAPTGLPDRTTWDTLATAYNHFLGKEG